MSMFLDCRNDDTYNEDFLNKEGMAEIFGFDYGVEIISNLFDNIDIYFDLDFTLSEFLNKKLPYKTNETYSRTFINKESGEFEEVPVKTYGDLLRAKIQEWAEMERNEYITSLIDDMDKEEYERCKKANLERNKKREEPKEYYNTRKFAETGEKSNKTTESSDDMQQNQGIPPRTVDNVQK